MSLRFATRTEIANWNDRIVTNFDGGNVFQGAEFAAQKLDTGWKPLYVVGTTTSLLVLEQTVPGIGKLWYVPKGPGVTDVPELSFVVGELREFAAEHGVFAVKIEPEIRKSTKAMLQLTDLGLVPVHPIQPNFSTVLVDLSPDLETIMANFNQKGRHAIRRAERDGVTIERAKATEANCQLFYDLLSETAANSFVIRPYDYYRTFWQRYSEAGSGQLFFAYVDGQVVAGAFAMILGHKSTYKDGASVRERTVYGASHLLQWHVMKWAKSKGSESHDLCSTPPSDQINNEKHRHYGIGRFKTSFNKEVIDYVGAFDLPISNWRYRLWTKIGERATLSLHWRRQHESWY